MGAASSLFWPAVHTLAANSNKMVAGPLRGLLTRANERVCPVNKGVGVKEIVEIVVYSVAAVPLGCQPPSASLYARTASTLVIACLPSIRLTRFLFRAGRAFLDSVRPGRCLRCHRSIVRGTATLLRTLPVTLPSPFLSIATIVVICIQSTVGHLVVSASVSPSSLA